MRRLIFRLGLIFLGFIPAASGDWLPVTRVDGQRFLSHSTTGEKRSSSGEEWIWWEWKEAGNPMLPKASGRALPRAQDFVGLLQEPQTDWDTQGESLILKRGALWLWMPEREWQIRLDSILCRWPRGVKGRLSFIPDRGRLEIFVSSGELLFPCFDFDEELKLSSGQGAFFQGPQGMLKVEKLPSGRLMPLGELGLLPDNDLKVAQSIFNSAWGAWKKALALQKKQEEERKRQQGLCHAPEAQFGQCMQRLEQGVCKLYRCTAQGEWAYAYTVTDVSKAESECSARGKVVPCR
jgi:hypothetical protein